MSSLNVLVVDDERSILDVICLYLEGMDGWSILKAGTPSEALALVSEKDIDLAIIDIKLPEMSGIELLQRVRKLKPSIEVVMISGHGDMQTVIECMRNGAIDYFSKPFELKALHLGIERVRKFIDLRRELQEADNRIYELSKSLDDMTGQYLEGRSKSILSLIKDIESYAKFDEQPVLLTGETGTGKEVAARHLHNLSIRRNKGFFAFNCAAIPESLFESELFGYKKGAFSGADRDKPGWFEIADKGTLLLDEIGEMSLLLQAKLLRVLEEKKVWKLGAVTPTEVNVRVIAATNQNIQTSIDKGRFRADLYYRLNVLELHLPPLRERKEDIGFLAEYFVRKFAGHMKKRVPIIAANVIAALEAYDFPGNVRQLHNIMERAVILCNEPTIQLTHLNLPYLGPFQSKAQTIQLPETIDLNLDAHEKSLIEKALLLSDNNKTKAAQKLGITLQTLLRRMEKYNIGELEKYN